MAKEFITFEEAMALLQVEDTELRELISSGELRAFRDENTLKLRYSDVIELKKKRESIPTIITERPGGEDEIILEEIEPGEGIEVEQPLTEAEEKPAEKEYISFDEALAELQSVGVDEDKLMEFISNGHLRAVRVENEVQLRVADVERLKTELAGEEAGIVIEEGGGEPAGIEPVVELEPIEGEEEVDETAPTVVPTIEIPDEEEVDETAPTVVPTAEEEAKDLPTVEIEEEEDIDIVGTGQVGVEETAETAVPGAEISPVGESSETAVPVAEVPAEEEETQVGGEIGLAEEPTTASETSAVTLTEEEVGEAEPVPQAVVPQEVAEEPASPLVTALLCLSTVILLFPSLLFIYGTVTGKTPQFMEGLVKAIQSWLKLGAS